MRFTSHLISFESVHNCYTYDSRSDSSIVRESCKSQRFHLHIDDISRLDLLQVRHLFVLVEITKRPVQPALPCKNAVE